MLELMLGLSLVTNLILSWELMGMTKERDSFRAMAQRGVLDLIRIRKERRADAAR